MQASAQLTSRDANTADVLFSSYGGRLYAYFRLMLADEAVAKRALADTLVAAAADAGRAGRLRDLDQYAPRLFALARAECHKHQSASAVGAGRHWTAGTHGADRGPGLPEVARRAVLRLSPDVREAYILSAPHNHLSLPQLAEVLGLGLDAAADLRAQAGLDFIRAVALCAQEADFTEFSGADLRIRAEESLASDAAEPPPSLPILSDPALAAFRDDVEAPPALPSEPTTPSQLTMPTRPIPPTPSARSRPELLETQASPHAPLPALTSRPTRAERRPDVTGYPAQADMGGQAEMGGQATGYRGPRALTGPLRAITEPLQFGDRMVRDRPVRRTTRRRRAAIAWAGGGIAAVAVAVIAGNALTAGSNSTITLTHDSGAPTGAVSPGAGLGVPMGSPQAGRPHPSLSQGAVGNGMATSSGSAPTAGAPGMGSVPSQAASLPTHGNSQSPAPVRHTSAPTLAPTKPPSKPTGNPSPTTSPSASPSASPSDSSSAPS
jgi:hypothetical protein